MRHHKPTGTVRSRTNKIEYLVNSFQDDYTTVNLFQDYGASFSQNCKRISGRSKGASGSWAEPYFACHLRCKWGFAYPPGILYRVFTGKRKENRIPGGILYSQIEVYKALYQQKIKRWKILIQDR